MGVGAGLYMCDVVKKKFTFAISSPDEFLYNYVSVITFTDLSAPVRTLSQDHSKNARRQPTVLTLLATP